MWDSEIVHLLDFAGDFLRKLKEMNSCFNIENGKMSFWQCLYKVDENSK